MLGQLYDGQSSIENASILEAEFENLVQGEAFRSSFEDLAQEYGTSLPSTLPVAKAYKNIRLNFYSLAEFRFNLAHAILGFFVDDESITEPTDPPCGLPYFDFIATRLLPCGVIDAPIEKFTGNDDVGPPPGHKEELTVALHAFTHFIVIFSRGNLLLCDLQGMLVIPILSHTTKQLTVF